MISKRGLPEDREAHVRIRRRREEEELRAGAAGIIIYLFEAFKLPPERHAGHFHPDQ